MVTSLRTLAIGAMVGGASLLAVTSAHAVPTLTFAGLGLGQGDLSYSGVDGEPLLGTDIAVNFLLADETTADGTYDCISCLLNFETGGSISEGPSTWTFGAGGTFSITGSVDGIAGSGPTLLSGSFTEISVLQTSVTQLTASFEGVGIDTKDPELTNFFGLGPTGWEFANIELAANPIIIDTSTGSFFGDVTSSSTVNAKQVVPEPGTLGLLGGGLLALGFFGAWRRKDPI